MADTNRDFWKRNGYEKRLLLCTVYDNQVILLPLKYWSLINVQHETNILQSTMHN